jgi:PKD repeat protein
MRAVLLGLLLVLLSLPHSNGVLFVSTGDPSYNTNAPSGSLTNSGWQYEGRWISYLATPIATNFFIAAKHIGGSIGDTFGLNGVIYHTVAFFDGPNTDLRLWQVVEPFPSYAPLYTKTDEVGKHCVVFGTGTDRGPAVVVKKATNGWEWGTTNNIQRWGENVITRAISNGNVGSLLSFAFDRKGGPNECALSYADSSGALFIEDGTTWKLAGIHYSVDGPFSRDGTTNTQFEAALLDLRGLYYLSGPNAWTLVPTNYPVTVPTSFYSSRISANISWIKSVIEFVPPAELQITSAPATTNALATIGNTAVVKPGDTIAFAVGASSTNGFPVGCLWDFGDGESTADCNPSHVFTNCGAYPVSVTLTDAVTSVTTGLTVAVACPMDISSLKLQAKFTRVGADTCAIKGALPGLPASFSLANAAVTFAVGGVQVDFQLDAKGRGANPHGNLKFSFNQKTGIWTFTGKLKGDMRDSWAKFGITSAITLNAEVTLPVVLLLQSDTIESFEVEPLSSYSNKSGSSGRATYPVN